jgi:hypothetical protein
MFLIFRNTLFSTPEVKELGMNEFVIPENSWPPPAKLEPDY